MPDNCKVILIIANGRAPGNKLLNKLATEADIIVACDGGANICYKNNIAPDFIVGDLDSINSKLKSFFRSAEIIYRPDQNENDLYKTLIFCKTLKPKKVLATAIFGKRPDHSFSNLFTLQSADFSFDLEFYDDYGITKIIKKDLTLNLSVGQTVSLISFLPVFGVTLSGFKYPLTNKNFPEGFNGTSNEIAKSQAKITVKKGTLIAFILNADN